MLTDTALHLGPRVVRAQLHGPRPYGGLRASSDRREIAAYVAQGWRIRQIRLLPRDPERMAALIQADREAPVLAEIENWEHIEAIVLAQQPPDVDALVAFIHRQTGQLHGQLYDLRAKAWGA